MNFKNWNNIIHYNFIHPFRLSNKDFPVLLYQIIMMIMKNHMMQLF